MSKHRFPKKWNGEIQNVEKIRFLVEKKLKFDYIVFSERKIWKNFSLKIEPKKLFFIKQTTDILGWNSGISWKHCTYGSRVESFHEILESSPKISDVYISMFLHQLIEQTFLYRKMSQKSMFLYEIFRKIPNCESIAVIRNKQCIFLICLKLLVGGEFK